MTHKKKPLIRWTLIILLCALLAAGSYFGIRYYRIVLATSHTPDHTAGEWIDLAPEGIVSANGTPVTSRMRLGAENGKVIVLFYGGGVSVDEYTASHPYTTTDFFNENGFYLPDTVGVIPELCDAGIGSLQRDNPFRDWTLIIIPYTTADYHIGTAEYTYTDAAGEEKTLYHHGYINYRALMDEAVSYVDGDVDTLLIAGSSAGGFGAAMLAEELIGEYFPSAENITVCIDSALQLWDNWKETARDIWGAPEALTEKMVSTDLIVDFLADLYNTCGDRVTFLYVGSVRDGALARYQSYFHEGTFRVNNRQGRMYAGDLEKMVSQLRESVPTIGIYLFDSLPYSIRPESNSQLTRQTVK